MNKKLMRCMAARLLVLGISASFNVNASDSLHIIKPESPKISNVSNSNEALMTIEPLDKKPVVVEGLFANNAAKASGATVGVVDSTTIALEYLNIQKIKSAILSKNKLTTHPKYGDISIKKLLDEGFITPDMIDRTQQHFKTQLGTKLSVAPERLGAVKPSERKNGVKNNSDASDNAFSLIYEGVESEACQQIVTAASDDFERISVNGVMVKDVSTTENYNHDANAKDQLNGVNNVNQQPRKTGPLDLKLTLASCRNLVSADGLSKITLSAR